jgi:hypothetical protein
MFDIYLQPSATPWSTHAATTSTRVVALLCRGKTDGTAVAKPEMVTAMLIRYGVLIVKFLVARRWFNVVLVKILNFV